ncbi:S-Ena type endospore appendage [Paenibacillus larvae]|uniref:S-Ena type endospore appendage n=1 Tax=Paenibacillus larvae TaxID=1464 RepID=UPI0034678C75
MFVVVHSAQFLIQGKRGGSWLYGKELQPKKNIECNCICHFKKRKQIKKCPRHSRTRKTLIKKLICIHRCVPINQKCDDTTTQTYFYVASNSNIKNPSGTITIINNSKSCTMHITVSNSVNGHEEIDVAPNSSFTAIVANIESVKILCKGQSNNDLYCTGSMQLDIHYTLMF